MDNGKICVLQFPVKDTKGGITQYVLGNWKFIDKSKFQFDFATMSPSLSFENDLRCEGCRVHHIKCSAEEDPLRFYEEFKELFKDNRIDVVHLHTGRWKSQVAEQVAKDCGVRRVIIHAHSTGFLAVAGEKYREELARYNKMVANLHLDMATDYWACSRPSAEFLFGDRIPQDHIRIMPNAIDIKRFLYNHVQRQKIRTALGMEKHFVFGHVGRLAYPKNQMFLLNALKQLRKGNPLVRLLLVGDGEDRDVLQKYVEANGLKDYVIFAGFRNDIEDMVQAFDAFVLPSFYEGFPLALLEAQASGLHCYVSDSITRETNVANHVTFLPLDETIWAEKLLEASRRPYIRENMYDAMTEAGFNIRYQIKEVEKGYRGEL